MPFYGSVETRNNGRTTNVREVNGIRRDLFSLEGLEFEFHDEGGKGELLIRQLPQNYGRVFLDDDGGEVDEAELEEMIYEAMESNPPVEVKRYQFGVIGWVNEVIEVPDFPRRRVGVKIVRLPF